jgi:hypothetical protein
LVEDENDLDWEWVEEKRERKEAAAGLKGFAVGADAKEESGADGAAAGAGVAKAGAFMPLLPTLAVAAHAMPLKPAACFRPTDERLGRNPCAALPHVAARANAVR